MTKPHDESLKAELKKLVRALRQKLGLSQEGLARRLDVSLKTVHRYENRQPPCLMACVKLRNFAASNGETEIAAAFDQAAFSMLNDGGRK